MSDELIKRLRHTDTPIARPGELDELTDEAADALEAAAARIAALEAQIATVAPAVDAQPVAIVTETHDSRGKPDLYTIMATSKLRIGDRLYASAQSEGLRKDALDALRAAEDALESCYDVTEFPCSGKSKQDVALETVRAALSQHKGEKDD